MVVLGIDPGFRHLGLFLAQVDSRGEITKILRTTVKNGPAVVIGVGEVLTKMEAVLRDHPKPELVGIEHLEWYGKRKGVLALAHLAGALWGYFRAKGADVRVFPPRFVKAYSQRMRSSDWDEHQKDALSLVHIIYNFVVLRRELNAIVAPEPRPSRPRRRART